MRRAWWPATTRTRRRATLAGSTLLALVATLPACGDDGAQGAQSSGARSNDACATLEAAANEIDHARNVLGSFDTALELLETARQEADAAGDEQLLVAIDWIEDAIDGDEDDGPPLHRNNEVDPYLRAAGLVHGLTGAALRCGELATGRYIPY